MKKLSLFILLLSLSAWGAEGKDIPKWQVEQAKQTVCDGFERILTWKQKLDHDKEIEKVSGVLDKDLRHRAGRAIVDGRVEAEAAVKAYEKLTGQNFTEKLLYTCDFWAPDEDESK